MKIRMNSKKTIVRLAIGVGMIAGFGLMLSGVPTRAFNPSDSARAASVGFVIDESQENGGYVALKASRPHLTVFDEEQENGSSFTPKITANDDFYWPPSLEGTLKLTAAPEMVIDEVQESGGYVSLKASRPQVMVFDEEQENGSSFIPNITANDDFYWPPSLEGSLKLTPAMEMVTDEVQENGSTYAEPQMSRSNRRFTMGMADSDNFYWPPILEK